MTSRFAAAMRRATKATRAFNVLGATRLIQKALAKTVVSPFASGLRATVAAQPGATRKPPVKASGKSGVPGEAIRQKKVPAPKVMAKTGSRTKAPKRLRRPLGEVLATLNATASFTQLLAGRLPQMLPGATAKAAGLPLPDGARFTSRSFTCRSGTRDFKLYVPASAQTKPKGLIVMLHGCTQNPDDFAAGTNMNALAEVHGLLIAYPAQTRSNNASSCWNWFEEGHQLRDAGEPAILAGLTRKLVSEFSIDLSQVFVAGLSAGAAMAVILGKTYPELFRAVGAHSGLAYQSAGNVMSAMAVMRGRKGAQLFAKPRAPDEAATAVRTIIFHGAVDRTVHPSNAQHIFDMAYGASEHGAPKMTSGSRNGRNFKRTAIAASKGTSVVESWLIDGAGHAWSGGNASGSYTDPKGPDASAEMVLFFLNAK